MKALVIFESMFGNTKLVAVAIGAGLAESATVELFDVASAPRTVPDDVDLVVLGGPTHAFSMSREATRGDAVKRGSGDTDLHGGIREWLEALDRGAHPQTFAAFDSRVDITLLPGSAAKSATKVAKKLGFSVVDPESFFVKGYEGPLLDGQIERATAWGRSVAAQAATAS